MDALINALKAHANGMDGQIGQTRIGVVTSFDPARYLARVTLQPEGVESGWLPITAHGIGAGWGIVTPLSINDQVLCLPQEGDSESLHIIGRVFAHQAGQLPPTAPSASSSGTDQSGNEPTNAQPGEFLLVSKAGAVLRLCSDGTVYVKGNLNMDGDLRVRGDVYDRHGSLDRLRMNYDAHKHNGVVPGSALTQTTDHVDAE